MDLTNSGIMGIYRSQTQMDLAVETVQRDLIVDQKKFFKQFRSVKPYLINDEKVPEKERLQSPEQRQAFDDATNCILCASCYSACPRQIKITKRINQTKQRIKAHRELTGDPANDGTKHP
ncbi:MAG: hypothetical protein U5K27_09340 [Desulfotignum sp.]|nr:hypothetical protein [Desulfotignum sp.]